MGLAEYLINKSEAEPADSPIVYALFAKKANPKKAIKTVVQNTKSLVDFMPYVQDVWQGKHILLRKPYDWMNKQEREDFINDATEYFDNYMVDHPVHTPFGDIEFRGNRAAESNPRYMRQYPLVRYNLSKTSKNIPTPNYKPLKRPDVERFDNLEVDTLGGKYIYQIRNNKFDKTKDFYNINEYGNFLNNLEKLKRDPELYQQFLNMQ